MKASPELTCPGGLGDGKVEGVHLSNCFGYPVTGPDQVLKACQLFKDQGIETIKGMEQYNSNVFSKH